MQESQLIVVPRVAPQKELFFLKPKTNGHGSQKHSGNIVHLPVKVCRKFLEARENFFGKPDVRLVYVVLAAYFVAFLFCVRLKYWELPA